jgi:hypothetical protein
MGKPPTQDEKHDDENRGEDDNRAGAIGEQITGVEYLPEGPIGQRIDDEGRQCEIENESGEPLGLRFRHDARKHSREADPDQQEDRSGYCK